MAILLSDDDVRAAGDIPLMIEAVQAALLEEAAGEVELPDRTNVMRDGTFLRIMPAYLEGSGVLGYKAFHGSMSKGVRYLVVVCSVDDGEILALVDAPYLTAARTGATSGVATRFMARPESSSVGVIGSGLEAETNLTAVAAVRGVERVKVFSPRPEHREHFAREMSERLGIPVQACGAAEDAVRDVDIVIVATNTGTNGPIAYHAAWLEPGQHVVSIGSTSPFLRELDPGCFTAVNRLVVDTAPRQILAESGDAIAASPAASDRLLAAELLCYVVAKGVVPGVSSTEMSMFKSVGTAAQDLASAKAVLDVARKRGLGRDIGELASPKFF